MTTVIVVNNRFTTMCTLKMHPSKDDFTITTSTVHRGIFDYIMKINDSAAIISFNYVRITRSKGIPSRDEYECMF